MSVADCPERRRLAQAVADAVQAIFKASADLEGAPKTMDPTDLVNALSEARSAKREAILAFHRHRMVVDGVCKMPDTFPGRDAYMPKDLVEDP